MENSEVFFNSIVRPNIRSLTPYRCARDDYNQGILLDANENSYGPGLGPEYQRLNRYPDPHQNELRALIAQHRDVTAKEVFVGVGSDEAIDLLIRVVCIPGKDSIIITPPTYGMYQVAAQINDVAVQRVPLRPDFQLDVPEILSAVQPTTKIVFLCSPGNPTAVSLSREDVEKVLASFGTGLVVVDEAYVDFSTHGSHLELLPKYPNLVVLQTMSKAYGLAGIRLGIAIGHQKLVEVLNKVKAPYNISQLTSEVAVTAMRDMQPTREKISLLLQQRERLAKELSQVRGVQKVFPTDANFILIRIRNARTVQRLLAQAGVVIRYRGGEHLCEECLRVTVGTEEENDLLLAALNDVSLALGLA